VISSDLGTSYIKEGQVTYPPFIFRKSLKKVFRQNPKNLRSVKKSRQKVFRQKVFNFSVAKK